MENQKEYPQNIPDDVRRVKIAPAGGFYQNANWLKIRNITKQSKLKPRYQNGSKRDHHIN